MDPPPPSSESSGSNESSGYSLELAADIIIVVCYFAIPLEIAIFGCLLRRLYTRIGKNVPFYLISLCFILFIIGCGITHIMGALSLVRGASSTARYRLISKWFTAAVSTLTIGIIMMGMPAMVKAFRHFHFLENDVRAKRDEIARLEQELIEKREILQNNIETIHTIKRNYIQVLSHEIRTPLNGFLNLSKSFEELTPSDYELLQYTGRVLTRIMNDIATTTTQDIYVQRDVFDLRKILAQFERTFQSHLQQKTIHWFVDDAAPERLVGDAYRMCQILNNVLDNAVKYSPAGSDITVQCKATASSVSSVSPSASPSALTRQHMTLRFDISNPVADALSEDQLHQFFREPRIVPDNIRNDDDNVPSPIAQFPWTVAVVQHGLGLGLAVCQKLLAALGGTISVHQENKIVTVSFMVPCDTVESADVSHSAIPSDIQSVVVSEPPPPPPPTRIVNPQGNKQGNERNSSSSSSNNDIILIAEDHPVSQKVLQRMLEKHGLKSKVASNGQEALESYIAHRDNCLIILMDIQMPKMNGFEATREIRKLEKENHWERTPIIAVTAFTEEDTKKESLQSGMDDFMTKPVKKDELEKIIHHWSVPRPTAGGH